MIGKEGNVSADIFCQSKQIMLLTVPKIGDKIEEIRNQNTSFAPAFRDSLVKQTVSNQKLVPFLFFIVYELVSHFL